MSKNVDAVTLVNTLVTQGVYSEEAGYEYMQMIARMVPSAANIKDYATIVHDKAILRRLITACDDIHESAYAEQGEVSAIVEEAAQRMFDIAQNRDSKEFRHIREIIGNVYLSLQELAENKGAITGHSGETRPGGLVGEMNNAEGKLVLEHCINYGAVTGVNQTGGLVARVEDGAEAKFSYCANFGTVTIGWSDGGGIIGKVTQSNTKVTFEHCYNSGRVNGASTTGGMVSFIKASELTLTDCHNGCFVKNCTCKGSEHGRLTNQKGSHTIGGLVAHMDQRSAIITITDSSNSGHLVAGERGNRNDADDANISKSYSRVGGIAAVMEGYRVKVENCHNYGKINSDYYIGGLFARAGSSGEATTKDGKTVYSEI
jgi:hypothetical protein